MHQTLQPLKGMHTAPSCRDVLSFLIHNHRFGLPIENIQEIVTAKKVTPLPRQSPGVAGLIHVRKQNILVLNLGHRLGLPHVLPHNGLMVILRSEQAPVAIWVSAVEQIHHIQRGAFSPNPSDGQSSVITEVANLQEGLLPVLDIRRLIPAASFMLHS